MCIKTISISDTIGAAKKDDISKVFSRVVVDYPDVEFGAHFHSLPNDWYNKINSAYASGCKRFDSTITGFGGCPMASNKLVGNIPSEKLITYFSSIGNNIKLSDSAFESAFNNFKSLIKV